ncbi:VanZ family protein [Thermus caliditerrae]|uniref:VanZ family protein n=1 Tax=Thermus caliditerrae TaxID=1330700 RepID=UPI001F248CA8|nr:VanZ family protein [Thermus caliditerrae]
MRPLPLLLALGHMGLLWWLSSQPATGMGLPHPWDKGAHFLAYLFLGLLLRLGLGRFLPAFLLAALYGALDEWHQSFVPGREAFGLDLLADALGAWAGAKYPVVACTTTGAPKRR